MFVRPAFFLAAPLLSTNYFLPAVNVVRAAVTHFAPLSLRPLSLSLPLEATTQWKEGEGKQTGRGESDVSLQPDSGRDPTFSE